ncbi:L,D-transpeptidase family protein [Sphingomonas sp. S1-29]|uniref:L,D-transpeptidase family protein n=1 Tax=Sphingomonas sp. S1-29 TaxID=2991074 RepID=UPI00223EC290|nr:L,D-transpeptidase family protein [Sphingomonas sp. S1-29]UZK69348.1 L,D-transpeptidase family protein [Sphingomonas sp. S1-29]
MVNGNILRKTRSLRLAALVLAATLAPQVAQARTPEVRSVLALEAPLVPGEYAWNADGVAAGPTRIVIDLTAQKLYVYRGGVEIGRAFILYGADHKPTPIGTFPILQKKRHHISNLYNAPMPYMQRLTWGGVAIHGSEVEANAATHGCVGVPDEFAALLFDATKMGDVVTVTRKWMPALYAAEIDAPDPHAIEEVVESVAEAPVAVAANEVVGAPYAVLTPPE